MELPAVLRPKKKKEEDQRYREELKRVYEILQKNLIFKGMLKFVELKKRRYTYDNISMNQDIVKQYAYTRGAKDFIKALEEFLKGASHGNGDISFWREIEKGL